MLQKNPSELYRGVASSQGLICTKSAFETQEGCPHVRGGLYEGCPHVRGGLYEGCPHVRVGLYEGFPRRGWPL